MSTDKTPGSRKEVLPPSPPLRLGTSSWSSADWVGPFYPPGTPPREYLSFYATRYDTVEVDSTWYRVPRASMVDGWRDSTPGGFAFAAKVPRSITHEKALVDCAEDMAGFVKVMERLGEKLGPLLLQFEYVAKGKDPDEYRTGAGFLSRLEAFLPSLPSGHRFVVEVRNETWLGPRLLDMLRARNVSLALTAYFTMPAAGHWMKLVDQAGGPPGEIAYVRFLGHHRRMDEQVAAAVKAGTRATAWGSLLEDRSAEVEQWIPALRDLVSRRIPVFAYFNNHYAGYGPGSLELFRKLWERLKA
ncbi:MAG: DUF72 domain-containing protein [Candidatus Eisenbacteria bacterium]|nr:DUF72 domain-containing protein [Candidatus Eisenbacteria bacterium]